MRLSRVVLISLMSIGLAACDALNPPPPTATREFSAPTLAASPTVDFQSSDELYSSTPAAGINDPTAAALPSRGSLPPVVAGEETADGGQAVNVFLPDDTILSGMLYDRGTVRVPGVILLATDAAQWGTVPHDLLESGITALVVEPPARAEDMQTVFTSFIELGTVDPARVALAGLGSQADLALMACALDEICDVVILLNPQARDTLANVIATVNPRPVFIAAAQADTAAFETAERLALLANTGTLVNFEQGAGVDLITANPDLTGTLVRWLTGIMSSDG